MYDNEVVRAFVPPPLPPDPPVRLDGLQQFLEQANQAVGLPAFLVEFAFYLAPGFEAVRRAFDGLATKPFPAALLAASAVIPI